MRLHALDKTLPRVFKLIPASVPKQYDILGLLNQEPKLLTAQFYINNKIYPVIIDTGATISCIPEYGEILRNSKLPIRKTSVNCYLANDGLVHINKKIYASVKPVNSTSSPTNLPFYINNGISKILDHEALFGLNHLRSFNLHIEFVNGRISIFHEGKQIGCEPSSTIHRAASLKIDTRFDNRDLDQSISQILKSFRRVFTDLDLEGIRGNPMRILTLHQRPIFAKQRHYSSDEILQMKEHIQGLLNKRIIEPTNSGYAATSRIILKKSGAGRLVVNYIPLNAVTLRDSYCLPHVSDILGSIQGMKYFSTMDCSQGFYQINVDYRDRHKTAFSTPIGNFQFRRCPFGARNSCAYFQAEMNRIFTDGLYTKCIVYVDDILIFGRTRQEHDNNLHWVLSKCYEYNVKIKLEKCYFAKDQVEYLGFIISGSSIKPLPSKIQTLSIQSPPKDKTELRSLIGKLNFYARFIPNYSSQLEPLRELFRKNKDYQWREYHQTAFEKLISSLKDATPQAIVNRDDPKIIELRVLDDSLEALLLSEDNKLLNRVSRLSSPTEANYSVTEKYLLCMVTAMKKFNLWLHPERFKIRVPTKELERAIKLVNRPQRVDNLLLQMPPSFDSYIFIVDDVKESVPKKRLRSHVPQEIYFVDGACQNNGKPDCRATWAVCAEYDKELELRGFVTTNPSNNAAELTAAIEACNYAKRVNQTEITIVTDSKYLHSAATVWIDKWKNNEWLDHKRKPVINIDLFKQLLYAKEGMQIEWLHVKGHADTPGNIRADNLARSLLDQQLETLCASKHYSNDIQKFHPEIDQLKRYIEAKGSDNYCIVR